MIDSYNKWEKQNVAMNPTTGDLYMTQANWNNLSMDTMGEVLSTMKELIGLCYELAPDEEYASYFSFDEIITKANNLLLKLGDDAVYSPDQIDPSDLELADALRLCEQWDGQGQASELENFDPITLLHKTQ
jgi:hypothetical protein